VTLLGALVLALLARPARAEIAVYDAGPIPEDGALYSDDGYHFAGLVSDASGTRYLVDGRPRASGAAGTISGPAALSADGSMLLHFVAAPGGWSLAINGRRMSRSAFPEIADAKLSANGRNAAYVAQMPQGWAVVSGQGTGPAFPKPPALLGVTEKTVLYMAEWSGRNWLYRNHQPVQTPAYDSVSVSPDLTRIAGVAFDRAEDRAYVDVDGRRYGPWTSAGAPAFSPNGRHWGFLASAPPGAPGHYDVLIVDGRPAALHPCLGCTLTLDNAARAFEDEIVIAIDDKTQIHRFFVDGTLLGRPPRVGSSRSGSHYAYSMLTGRGNVVGLDGKTLETDAPLATPLAPPVFDGESEYHYWSIDGRDLLLVCGAVDGSNPRRTRCAGISEGLGRKPPTNWAPPSSPATGAGAGP
jgi:hypothetical protein